MSRLSEHNPAENLLLAFDKSVPFLLYADPFKVLQSQLEKHPRRIMAKRILLFLRKQKKSGRWKGWRVVLKSSWKFSQTQTKQWTSTNRLIYPNTENCYNNHILRIKQLMAAIDTEIWSICMNVEQNEAESFAIRRIWDMEEYKVDLDRRCSFCHLKKQGLQRYIMAIHFQMLWLNKLQITMLQPVGIWVLFLNYTRQHPGLKSPWW